MEKYKGVPYLGVELTWNDSLMIMGLLQLIKNGCHSFDESLMGTFCTEFFRETTRKGLLTKNAIYPNFNLSFVPQKSLIPTFNTFSST